MAAPSATTSSGFTESLTGLPKNLLIVSFTKGTLVLPPTITTTSISVVFKPASFNALPQQVVVLSTSGCISDSNICFVIDNLSPFNSAVKLSLDDK